MTDGIRLIQLRFLQFRLIFRFCRIHLAFAFHISVFYLCLFDLLSANLFRFDYSVCVLLFAFCNLRLLNCFGHLFFGFSFAPSLRISLLENLFLFALDDFKNKFLAFQFMRYAY